MLSYTTKTGRSRASHNHIMSYDAEGNGQTSLDKDHLHLVEGLILQPAGKDNHIHELDKPTNEDGPQSLLPEGETEADNMATALQFFDTAESGELEFREKGRIAEGFYDGDGQWDKGSKQKRKSENRAALTINEIEPKIDSLSGQQRKNRMDITVAPTEEGDDVLADILTQVIKHISNNVDLDQVESQVFEDQSITGRGLFDVWVDKSNPLAPQIITERLEWDECYFGTHNKFDASDCEHIHKIKWMSIDKVKQLWPDKADKVNMSVEVFITPEQSEGSEEPHKGVMGRQYTRSQNNWVPASINPRHINVGEKEVAVIETSRRVYSKIYFIVDPERNGDNYYISKKDANRIKTIEGYLVKERDWESIRKTVMAAAVVLEDFIDEDFGGSLSTVPVYAKKRKKKVWGKVKAMQDPQRELDKRHSQVSDLLDRMQGNGWQITENTFEESEERKFKKNSARSGFVTKTLTREDVPNRIEGPKFPAELVNLMLYNTDKIKSVSSIDSDLFRSQGDRISGAAILQMKEAGLVGNEFLYDNLSIAKRQLGRIYLKLIPKHFSPERIWRILFKNSRKEEFNLTGININPEPTETEQLLTPEVQNEAIQQRINQYKTEIIKLYDGADFSQYDVVITESAWNPTTRRAYAAIYGELLAKGVDLPVEGFLSLTDFPRKETFIASMQQQKQAQAQQEQAKNQTEIVKSLPDEAKVQAVGGGQQVG